MSPKLYREYTTDPLPKIPTLRIGDYDGWTSAWPRIAKAFLTKFAIIAPTLVSIGRARGDVYAGIEVLQFCLIQTFTAHGCFKDKMPHEMRVNRNRFRPLLRSKVRDYLAATEPDFQNDVGSHDSQLQLPAGMSRLAIRMECAYAPPNGVSAFGHQLCMENPYWRC